MRLEVVRAPGAEVCPSREDFENRLTVLLGGEDEPIAADAAARLVVMLERTPGTRGYRGRSALYGEDGALVYRRELGPFVDCAVLADGLALGFVVHWQAAPVEGPAPAGEGIQAPPPATSPAAGSPPPSVLAPDSSSSPWPPLSPVRPPVCKLPLGDYCLDVDIYSLGLSAGAIMTAGFTADVGPGAYLGAEIRPIERFSFELQLRGIFPARVVASDPIDPTQPYDSPKEPDVSHVAVHLVPCFRYSFFMGCVVGQFGLTVFQTPAEAATAQSVGVGPRLGVEIPFLDRFAVRVFGDAIFEIPPLVYRIRDVNLQWTQSPVGGFFGAGLVVNFK